MIGEKIRRYGKAIIEEKNNICLENKFPMIRMEKSTIIKIDKMIKIEKIIGKFNFCKNNIVNRAYKSW